MAPVYGPRALVPGSSRGGADRGLRVPATITLEAYIEAEYPRGRGEPDEPEYPHVPGPDGASPVAGEPGAEPPRDGDDGASAAPGPQDEPDSVGQDEDDEYSDPEYPATPGERDADPAAYDLCTSSGGPAPDQEGAILSVTPAERSEPGDTPGSVEMWHPGGLISTSARRHSEDEGDGQTTLEGSSKANGQSTSYTEREVDQDTPVDAAEINGASALAPTHDRVVGLRHEAGVAPHGTTGAPEGSPARAGEADHRRGLP